MLQTRLLIMVVFPVILAILWSMCKPPKLLLGFNTILRSLVGASNSLDWVKFTPKLLIPPGAAPRPLNVKVKVVAGLFASSICWIKKEELDHSLIVES
jgi:hypothetical protein